MREQIPKQPSSPEGQSAVAKPGSAMSELDAFQAELRNPNFSIPTVGPKNDAEQAIENGVYDRAYTDAMDKLIAEEGPMASSGMGEYARTGQHNLFSYRVAEAAGQAVEHHRNVKALAEHETRERHGAFLGQISAANAGISGAFDKLLAPKRNVDPNAAPDTFTGWFGKGSAAGAKKGNLSDAFDARHNADAADAPTVEVSHIDPAHAEDKPADKPAGESHAVVPGPRTTGESAPNVDDVATDGKAVGRAKVPAQPEGDAEVASILYEPTQVLPVVKKPEAATTPDADPAKPDDDLDATPMASNVLWDQGKFPAAYGFRGENLGENLGVYPEAHGMPEKVNFADESLDIKNMGKAELEFIDLIAARNDGADIRDEEIMSRMRALDDEKSHPGLGTKLFDRFAVDGAFIEALPEGQPAGLSPDGARLIRALRESYERPSAEVTDKIIQLVKSENKREGRIPLEYALDAGGNPVFIVPSKAKGDVTPKVRNGDLLLETFLGAAPKQDEIKNPYDTRGKFAKLRSRVREGLGKLLVRGEGPLMDGDWYQARHRKMWETTPLPSDEMTKRELRFVNAMPYSDLKFMDPAELAQRLTSQEARDRFDERRAKAGYANEYKNGTKNAKPATKPGVRPKRTYQTVAQSKVAQETQGIGESYPVPYTPGEQAYLDQFERDERKTAEEYVDGIRAWYSGSDARERISRDTAGVQEMDPDTVVHLVASRASTLFPQPVSDALWARFIDIQQQRESADKDDDAPRAA